MNFFLRSLLLLSAILLSAHAFQRLAFSRHTSADLQTATALKAWSLTPPSRFGTFEHTWYNEVQYPTGGRPVYEDSAPYEYRFVTPGNDWPTIGDKSETISLDPEQPRIKINPLRRAAKWISSRRN